LDLIPQYGQRRRCKGDLLWHDSTTGTVAIRFMNGATVASSAGLGNVGTTWTVQATNAE